MMRTLLLLVAATLCIAVLGPIAVAQASESVVVDLGHVVELGEARAWVPLAALVIGLIVRLLKSERGAAIVGYIPPRYRPIVALGLGMVSAVLEAVVAGQSWTAATVGGLLSTAIAVLGHDVGIEGLRSGREIGVPKEPTS